MVFQNETHFYYLCKSVKDGHAVVELYKSVENENASDSMELVASQVLNGNSATGTLDLKIESHGSSYLFLYGDKSGKWNVLKDGIDASFLSTKVAGGFVGCMYALYATSIGKESASTAYFDWFKYKGNNEAYGK